MQTSRNQHHRCCGLLIVAALSSAVGFGQGVSKRATLPTIPQNVKAVAQTPFIVQVTWSPSSSPNGIGGYHIIAKWDSDWNQHYGVLLGHEPVLGYHIYLHNSCCGYLEECFESI